MKAIQLITAIKKAGLPYREKNSFRGSFGVTITGGKQWGIDSEFKFEAELYPGKDYAGNVFTVEDMQPKIIEVFKSFGLDTEIKQTNWGSNVVIGTDTKALNAAKEAKEEKANGKLAYELEKPFIVVIDRAEYRFDNDLLAIRALEGINNSFQDFLSGASLGAYGVKAELYKVIADPKHYDGYRRLKYTGNGFENFFEF